MEVIPFEVDSHYEQVCKWWKGHKGWEAIPSDLLPSTGFYVVEGDKGMCAGWVYETNDTPVALLEWVISDPDLKGEQKDLALELLLEAATKYCDDKGFKVIFHFTKGQRWKARLKESGFIATEVLTSMVRANY